MRVRTSTDQSGHVVLIQCPYWYNVEYRTRQYSQDEDGGAMIASYEDKAAARLYQKISARTDLTHGRIMKAVRKATR